MLRELMEILSLDVEETIEKIMTITHAENQLLKMLQLLTDNPDNDEYNDKLAA